MNRIPSFISRCVFGFVGASLPMALGQDQEPAVSAEVWSYEIPENLSAKSAFERWRSQNPGAEPKRLAVEGLSIPGRVGITMVRVAGVLSPPVSGDYAFTIHSPGANPKARPDETEFWIQDDTDGGWKLAQCAGNPNKRSGRTRLEAGVERRFEVWTMGSKPIAVRWEVVDTAAAAAEGKRPDIKLALQTVPSSAISARKPSADDPLGDGLRGFWKRRHALDDNEEIGPGSPWGDPDGDGLVNWQEQATGTDPKQADAEGRDGLVRWEIWRDIPGRYVFDLTRAGHFPTGQREVRFLDRLEIPTGNGDRYGSRLRGLIKAPADGEYTFHVIADDGAELWLGEDESWQTKRLIAKANQPPGSARLRWTNRDEKGVTIPLPAEQCAKLTLKAGQSYYLEILHKQDSGQDHCAVAWTLPGKENPELIASRHLVSWKPCPTDTDDDGLPDDWQRSAKLTDGPLRHCEADADGDGVSNRDEWRAQTDPLNPVSLPVKDGMLTSQAWTGVPGHSVASLTGHDRFPDKPDVNTHIDNLDFGREGDHYGVRLRGFLTAPSDGSYQFSIAGNNACVLYLSDSENKFAKRPVARVEVGTGWRSFSFTDPQPTGRIALEKGRRYYVEVIFKRHDDENNREDHSSVAWIPPGEKKFRVISPEFFSPYATNPDDLDDDDLPDAWEKNHQLSPSVPGGKHGAWGDPDGDGLENFREFQLGLDPNRIDVHGTPGLALWEMWDNRADLQPAVREGGASLSGQIKLDERFPLEPTVREWRDALESPRRQGNDFGARLRAQIVAPATGDYVFSIAARDIGELFLSTDASKFRRQSIASVSHGTSFRSWDKRPGQMSKPIHLESGKAYYLEALFARGPFQYNDDFLSIAWKPPGAETFSLIGAEHLVAFFRDPNDQDDDELPDDWEKRYGLDATDPHGDHGPEGDPDRDDLTNMREYQLGSDPRNGDSDGDGVSDHDEIHVYGSDPLVKDAVPPVPVADLPLGSVITTPGNWMLGSDGTLTATAQRGNATFGFTIEKPGIHVVRLSARSVSSGGYAPLIPLTAFVDGGEIGNGNANQQGTPLSWLSQWLSPGSHTVTIRNGNLKFAAGLQIMSIELLRVDGEDRDDNGLPDWLESVLTAENGFDQPDLDLVYHDFSPACIEGVSRLAGGVSLFVDGTALPAKQAIGKRWYVDVPLARSGETVVVGSFENSTKKSRKRLVWRAVNPLVAAERIEIRAGDSMKFSVPRNGEAETLSLSHNGDVVLNGTTGSEVVVKFERPGDHSIEAILHGTAGNTKRRIVIAAVAADFGATFNLAAGSRRVWSLPDVPAGIHLDADPRLSLEADTPLSKGGRKVTSLWTGAGAARPGVLARLGSGGPVLASTRLNVFKLVDAAESGDAHVVEILPDGTRVVEISYMIEGEIPADFSMWIDFAVTDAVFADGSTRYRLTAADFDETGTARVKIYKAPGDGQAFVCHWNRLYEDAGDDAPAPAVETEDAE